MSSGEDPPIDEVEIGPSAVTDDERTQKQLQRREAVRPSKFANLFIHHTKKTCACACLVPIVAILILAALRVFTLDDPSGPEYFVRDDIRTRLSNARSAALDELPYVEEDGSEPKPVTQEEDADDLTISLILRGKNQETGQIAALNDYDSVENVLTREAIALHKQAEDVIFLDEQYTKFCKRDPNVLDCDGKPRPCVFPRSYLQHQNLYGVLGPEGQICDRRTDHDVVSEEDFEAFLNDMFGENQSNLKNFFDNNVTSSERMAWASQSFVPIGVPFEGFDAVDDREAEQEEKYIEWASDLKDTISKLTTESFDAYAISSFLGNSQFSGTAFRDLSFLIAAIVLVFIVLWFHTSSFFLAGSAILQIFLSFPLAFVIYHFIFRQLYFSALQILTIFLVLGIGADDVFVFTDAWKQAAVVLGPDVDLVTRMSWTYRRAVRAMTVTSFTTAAAFFVNAASPIMPIATLGVWAGLLILLVYLLVITVYPCSIAIWHRFWRPRMFVRGFRKPPPDEIEREIATPLWHRLLPKSRRPAVKAPVSGEYRRIERFFHKPWFNLIRKIRFVLLALGIILVALAIWLATGLEPPKDAEQFLPNDHPVVVAFTTLSDGFPRSEADLQLQVAITWGLKDIDRNGTSKYDVKELGRPVYDTSFDLTKAAVQEHILKSCEFFGNQDDIIFQEKTGIKPVECWIADFKEWRTITKGETSFKDYSSQQALIQDLRDFGAYTDSEGRKPYLVYLQEQHVAFNDTSVLVTEVRFIGSTETEVSETVMWPVYLRWQEELQKLNQDAPDGANNAIATAGFPWLWQITQRKLISTMFVGIGVMIPVALGTLIVATLNWSVAILATICIGGIIAMLLGIIRLLGWPLGIAESVGVVIGVGYSFDGVAHVATAYVESKSKTRVDRTQDALTDLGISVLFGSLTTLLAGLMLFPAIIIFFVKFAGLIVSTIILSLLWSLGFFPAVLMILGPEGDFGSIKALINKLFGRSNDSDIQPLEFTDSSETKDDLKNTIP